MKRIINCLNDKILYENNYLKIWMYFYQIILKEHEKYNYQMIYGAIDDLLKEDNVHFDLINPLNLKSYSFYRNELDARSEAFRLLSEYEKIINQYFGMYVINGYKDKQDNSFVVGILTSKKEWIKCLQIEINYLNGFYQINATYFSEIVLSIVSFYDDYKLMMPSIVPHKFGGIILGKGHPETKSIMHELSKIHNILWVEGDMSVKEKYTFLKDEGVIYIFEIKNHGKLKLRTLYDDESIEVNIKSLNTILLNKDNEIKDKIRFISMNNVLEWEKENEKFYCKECFHKLLMKDCFVKPFNQRVIKKSCSYCLTKAEVKIIQYSK